MKTMGFTMLFGAASSWVLWLTLFVGKPAELHGADGTLGVGVGLGNAC